MDTDSHSYDSIAAVRRELETLEALALATEREAQELASPTRRLVISTKPEIRKGCTWDVHFAIDTALLKEEGISKLYVLNAPKSKAERAPVLALTVRSKLIKPTLELAFTKVAKIVSERDYLTPNSAGVVVLKTRFTARPRAVFHKHADVMILVAHLKIGDRVICSDTLELLFRGGTGSIHGAENRGRASPASSVPSTPNAYHQNFGYSAELSHSNAPFPPNAAPSVPVWKTENDAPHYSMMNSAELRDDFLQNNGDTLLLAQPPSRDLHLTNSSDMSTDWPADTDGFDNGFVSSLMTSSASSASFASTVTMQDALLQTENETAETPQYTIVFDKRRGGCTSCKFECSHYRGTGGPCSECGCYPARHVDLDAPRSRKRKASDAGLPQSTDSNKKPRFLLEAKYFQKLFFSSLKYMTLEEISTLATVSPIPIFVKDESAKYIFINHTFSCFIMDLSRTELLNHTAQQVFDPSDATAVDEQDRDLFASGEGTVRTYDVSLKQQSFRVMKNFTSLRDGTRVIVGALVSSL